jgi:hypothetical protein
MHASVQFGNSLVSLSFATTVSYSCKMFIMKCASNSQLMYQLMATAKYVAVAIACMPLCNLGALLSVYLLLQL